MQVRSKVPFRLLSLAGALTIVCPPARADSFIPTLCLLWPAAWLVLIPVILVEAYVAVRVLGLSYSNAFKAVGSANLRSTLVGIPVTGLLMAAVQVWTLIAGLGNLDTTLGHFAVTTLALTGETDDWMIPAVAILHSVPFFFTSVYVERRSMAKHLPEADGANLRRWAWQANLLSYGLIDVGLAVATVLALRS